MNFNRFSLQSTAAVIAPAASLVAHAQITTVAFYNFENTTSGVLPFYGDATGHGFNYIGTNSSSATFSTDVAPTGGSFAFSGTSNSGAFITDSAPISTTTDFGIQLLFKNPSGTTSVGTLLMAVGHPNETGSANIFYDPVNNTMYGQINGIRIGEVNEGAYTENAWNSAALVLTGDTATFYINGSAVASVIQSLSSAPTKRSHILINPGSTSIYTGLADNIQIFTFANGTFNPSTDLATVPEPAATALLAGVLGLGAVIGLRRRLRAGRSQ